MEILIHLVWEGGVSGPPPRIPSPRPWRTLSLQCWAQLTPPASREASPYLLAQTQCLTVAKISNSRCLKVQSAQNMLV